MIMKQSTKNTLRNCIHILAGFVLVYTVMNEWSKNSFDLWEYYTFGMIFGTGSGLIIGGLWEGFKDVVFKEPSDVKDIMRTMYGGMSGVIVALFFKDITLISTYLFWLVLAGALADIFRAYRNMKSKK